MRRGLPVILLTCGLACVVACSDDAKPAAKRAERDGDAGSSASQAGAAARRLPENTGEPVYTAEQKERYREHLRAGRELGREDRWGEAMVAFEGALEAIPMDGRALSELGWAAFQAGDFDRARAANRDAARVSTDTNVRASAMYNLGRVAEALGQRDEAAHYYRASLELRPSPSVRARLAGLPAVDPRSSDPGEPASCPPAPSVDRLCQCLIARAGPDKSVPKRAGQADAGASALACNREPRQVPGVELLFVGDRLEERVHLIAQSPRGWSAVAELGTVHHPEQPGSHQELEIARFETRRLGERKILWVEAVQSRSDRHARYTELRRVRHLTVCSWAPESRELGCALQVPLREERARKPAAKRAEQPGPPAGELQVVQRIEVDVRENGTAKVILVKGKRTEAVAPLLGERKLW